MRKRIYEIIETAGDNDKVSSIYDASMLLAIIISIIPLGVKQSLPAFYYTDLITTALFIFDYFLRLITADYKLQDHSAIAFVKYPFTPCSIYSDINSGFITSL